MKNINGCFCKIGRTENSIIVGTIGALKIPTYDEILQIAIFYNINTELGVFSYHFITKAGAEKRGCKFPLNNYNEFIEFFI